MLLKSITNADRTQVVHKIGKLNRTMNEAGTKQVGTTLITVQIIKINISSTNIFGIYNSNVLLLFKGLQYFQCSLGDKSLTPILQIYLIEPQS